MKKKIVALTLALTLGLGLCACGEKQEVKKENGQSNPSIENQKDDNTEETENTLPTLHIASMNTIDLVPLQVICQKKLDEANGFSLEIDLCATKEEQISLLEKNKDEGALLSVVDLCSYRDKGMELQTIGQNMTTYRLVANKDVEIDVISNAKGAKTAVMKDTLDEYLLDALLAQGNFRDDFVTKENVDTYLDGVEGIKNGKYEMALLKEPYATQAILDGAVELGDSYNQYESTFMVAFDYSMLSTKADLAKKFVKAYSEASEMIYTLETKELNEYLKNIEGFTKEVLNQGINLNVSVLMIPVDEELEGVISWAVSHQLCKKEYMRNELVYEFEE